MENSITWSPTSGKLFMIKLHLLNLPYLLSMVKQFHIHMSRQFALHPSQERHKICWILGLFIRKFPHIFRPLSPILSIFFVKIPHIVQHLLMEMNGSTPISSNPSKNLDLPYLKELLVAFFTGADETWTRFTSEFAPGGLIDAATTEERDLAWMPATNDENEGALGSFRKLIRQQPQLTMQAYNGLTMFFRNNTELFMEAKFTTEEDYKFLHK